MSRKRITAKNIEAADASFGQSSNDYLRSIAKDAIKGALDDVTKKLWVEAQQVANKEAEIIGVTPADYDVSEMYTPENVTVEALEADLEASTASTEEENIEIAEETEVTEASDEAEIEKEEDVKTAMIFEPNTKTASKGEKTEMIFEPNTKTAGAPTDAACIGKENWFQVQEKFPQYTKQQKLTMLAVAPTGRNTEAVSAVTDTLDSIAGKLEEAGDQESATQLDVVSELLTASVQECKKIASEK